MAQTIIQSSFQFGEVSELLHSQVDSAIYYKSARRLRNVQVMPQGGAQKRFGTSYVNTIAGITDYTQVKAFMFEYKDGSVYYLLFRNLAIDVYFEGSIVNTVITTYTSSQIANLDIAQSSDAAYIVHDAHIPAILTRTSAHAGWNLDATPNFVHYPTYDFEQNYNTFKFAVFLPGGAANLAAAQNLLGHAVELTCTSAIFTDDHIGGLYYGDSGTIRITALHGVAPATIVDGKIIQVFDELSSMFVAPQQISGEESVLTEVAFSVNRGYPQKVAFFQNRIWFGKTSALLAGIWGSNFAGYTATSFLFNDAEDLDTSAISTVLAGPKSIIIESMVSFKTLIVMTSNGLYSSPLFIESPLTPKNVAFVNKQTSDSSTQVPPVIFDNEVIFFDKGGKKVKNLAVSDNGYNYNSQTISVLAPHLIDSPYSADVYQNSSLKDGSWLFLVNSGTAKTREGTLAIYQSVPEQSITAWTLSDTDGKFRHVDSNDELVYFIIERVIDGNTVLYIEQLDFDLNTDSTFTATYGSPTTTITGLTHLEGETVVVKGDGAPIPQSDPTVVGGQIELEHGVESVEVGLKFVPLVRPMPLNVPTQSGNNLYLPKSINEVYVDYFETVGITVNGTLLPPYQFGVDQYDTEITLKTNFSKVDIMGGWDPRVEVNISQDTPMPFTIIGVGYDVTI